MAIGAPREPKQSRRVPGVREPLRRSVRGWVIQTPVGIVRLTRTDEYGARWHAHSPGLGQAGQGYSLEQLARAVYEGSPRPGCSLTAMWLERFEMWRGIRPSVRR